MAKNKNIKNHLMIVLHHQEPDRPEVQEEDRDDREEAGQE